MVDRYSISSSPETLKKFFGLKELENYQVSYNAGPTQELPVLLSGSPQSIEMMTWGLISRWSNNRAISPKLFNLPADQAFEKKMYQQGLRENRCIILADGFFVWKQIGKAKRVPYYFYQADKQPLGVAGLWESYEDMDGNPTNTFIMITLPATAQVAPYQDDMPLILAGSNLKSWLDPNIDVSGQAKLFLAPLDEKLKFHSVSPLISNLENNNEELIKATLPSDQHGNYTLFN